MHFACYCFEIEINIIKMVVVSRFLAEIFHTLKDLLHKSLNFYSHDLLINL